MFFVVSVCVLMCIAWERRRRKAWKAHLWTSCRQTNMMFVVVAIFISLLISFKVTFNNFPDCWAYNNISYVCFSVKLRIIPLIDCVFMCVRISICEPCVRRQKQPDNSSNNRKMVTMCFHLLLIWFFFSFFVRLVFTLQRGQWYVFFTTTRRMDWFAEI